MQFNDSMIPPIINKEKTMTTESLCIFIHYSRHPYIPFYVQVYVNELANYFSKVVIVHNKRPMKTDIKNLKKNISLVSYENEGYDFGLFYKYFRTIQPENFSQIACINDSNILINKLEQVIDWGQQAEYDFWGLMDSNERPWFSSHNNNYHIQSHFLVFKRKAIGVLANFINTIDAEEIFAEKDPKKLRRLVIDKWEIGLSRYLFDADLSGGSYVDCQSFLEQYNGGKPANIGHKFYPELIESGVPVLKKRIMVSPSYRDRLRIRRHWKKLIIQHGKQSWNMKLIIDEMDQMRQESSDQFFQQLKIKLTQRVSMLLKQDTN